MSSTESVSTLRGIPLLANPYGRLSQGCYSLLFKPDEPYDADDDNPEDTSRGVRWYPGTLRVVRHVEPGAGGHADGDAEQTSGGLIRISGDLYASAPEATLPGYADIPIFPRAEYRFHLRGEYLRPARDGGFELTLVSYELRSDRWQDPETVIVRLRWCDPPDGARRSTDCLFGEVYSKAGERIGTLEMTWVSRYLRSATVELDVVGDINPPTQAIIETDDGFEAKTWTWARVFDPVGWRVELGDLDRIAQPDRRAWAEFELQQALPALRDSVDTDREWRYHVFCVGAIEDGGRGYKFDTRGSEAGSGLFESVVLAAKYEFPDDEAVWGNLAGRTLDETPLYFRVAVHEVGHAMKLDHNDETRGFMATTDFIRDHAGDVEAGDQRVVSAVDWSFAPSDIERLRHWPDITVRPGGWVPPVPLPGIDDPGHESETGRSTIEAGVAGLELEVVPIEESFPFGAPVRLSLNLWNRGVGSARVPALRLKSGNLSGVVRCGAEERAFFPIARTVDEWCPDVVELPPNRTQQGSLCLLRGFDGPLFPNPGDYTVVVRLEWYVAGVRRRLVSSVDVSISTPVDDHHAKAAARLMATAETLEGFAIGGDGFADGNQAINLALNNPQLKGHFAVIELRRLLRDYGNLPGRLDAALQILATPDKERWILAPSEAERLIRLLVMADQTHEGATDSEKCHVAMRIVLGRISKALEDEFVSIAKSNPNAAAKRASGGYATRSEKVTSDRKVRGTMVPGWIPEALAHALLPPEWERDYRRAQEYRDPKRKEKADDSAKTTRSTLERTGIGLEALVALRQRLKQLEVPSASIADAVTSLVRALRRIPITLHDESDNVFRFKTALVANLLSNLIAGGFDEAGAALDALSEPRGTQAPWEGLIQSVLGKDSQERKVKEAISALARVGEGRSRAFSDRVHSLLTSPPLGTESEMRIRKVIAKGKLQVLSDGAPPEPASS